MDKMKCHICDNYLHGLERCKYCSFEYRDDLPWTNDVEWDIFDIDDDVEWSFLQIQYRLKAKGVDVLQVINWCDGDAIVLIGVHAYPSKVAMALQVSEECISSDLDMGIMVVNLFKEKCLRTYFKDVEGEELNIVELVEVINEED